MNQLIPIACLALLGTAPCMAAGQASPQAPTSTTVSNDARPASAPQVAAEPAGAPNHTGPTPVAQVSVTGTRANDTDLRRMSTAAKMVFGREELDRNGDTSVGDILKRLPGVTVGGPPGRGGGGGVRMRGLGNGYTQMLVNGERPPPGFSLESLSPDQVERIEVMRGPVAEHSTQAIAGTINIVLREGYQQKDIQLRLGDSIARGLHSPSVSLAVPGKSGNLSWLTNVMVNANRTENRSETTDREQNEDGSLRRAQQLDSAGDSRSKGLHVSPRLSYKFENGDSLSFQPFLGTNRSNSRQTSTVEDLGGSRAPDYALLRQQSEASTDFLRGFGNWLHKMDNGAKLDVKFGGGIMNGDTRSVRNTYDASGKGLRVYNDSDDVRHRSINNSGKYTRPVGKGHLLAIGWDGEITRLNQVHVAEDDGGALFEESGATLQAHTRRFALFAQDEWDIGERWSAYLGLRWEGIRTTSESASVNVKNTSSVFSPVLHTVWRIPGSEKDQVRASYTQSYRAAPLNDMIAAPTYSADNLRTRPDRAGNPDLKPELARGIDLAYEHYVGKSGIVSASAFVRDIDDLIRRVVEEVPTGQGLRWVSRPANIGKARTAGIELEAKFQLPDLVENAPNIDVRANYSRFWSDVEGIPGPDNRLDGQAEQTANIGADWRLKTMPLTLGASLNWTPETSVQTSVTELSRTGVKRQLDLYGLWKFSASTQLRISASNLLAEDYDTARYLTAPVGATTTRARTDAALGVRLEMKL